MLRQDKDLKLHKTSKKLAYACSGLVFDPSQARRRLLGEHEHSHGHSHSHEHGHSHGLPRRLRLPAADSKLELSLPGRQLQQLWPAQLADPVITSANLSASGVPLLYSRRSATRKIFLDFDGHTTTGTQWNNINRNGAGLPITTPAFDRDGNPSTFSSSEHADIVAIWRAVAEDFAAFDVDVTTEDPGELVCWRLRSAWAVAAQLLMPRTLLSKP